MLVGLLTLVAIGLDQAGYVAHLGLSALTLAIILGMLLGNTLYPRLSPRFHAGVLLSKGPLLRWGIILYGMRLTFQQIAAVGGGSLLSDAVMLISTFLLAYHLGTRWLKLDRDTAILIGAGSSICGAAAVMATEPILRAQANKVTVAVATVVIFGTLAMFLYPLIHAGQFLPITDKAFGLYIGSSVHEVAQVVAAGREISPEVANVAVTTKMIRVMMLAPFLVALSLWLARTDKSNRPAQGQAKITVPWFAFGFIAMAGFNSLNLLPTAWVDVLIYVDTLLLTMAMAALGLTTHFKAIREAGLKPLLLGLVLFLWLMLAGAGLQVLLA
ncbi:MAG: YeiH family putative sulfate export transporter [Neisseriaceae bacterium]|nr:YeiH family putative sulfate export transporter [Neisseriaceae bacterium]MBP6861812.1 YeiH family putative sulfate export transporter [Neisseriaceae bacterium]